MVTLRRCRTVLAALIALVAISAVGCTGDDNLTAYTTVDDVADMADGAPVMLADVRIGSVVDISLTDDHRARLRLTLERDSRVPAAVTARVRRTSVIGEKFVELLPDASVDEDAPLLEDGDVIEDSEVVPDIEHLVTSGAELLGAVTASELAVLLDEGARGFAGNGQHLRTILDGFDTVLAGYRARTATIESLVRAIDGFAADVGPAADAHATAIANLAVTARILAEERVALVELLASLRDLSVEGRSILDAHVERMQGQLASLRTVTDVLRERQDDLGLLLENLPHHNRTVTLGIKDDYVQVLTDVILCGVPGGGEDADSPVSACRYVPQEPRR